MLPCPRRPGQHERFVLGRAIARPKSRGKAHRGALVRRGVSPPAYRCFLAARKVPRLAKRRDRTQYNAFTRDRNNDIPVGYRGGGGGRGEGGELTDYCSFGATSTAAAQGLLIYFKNVTTAMLYLYAIDSRARVILHFLTCVPRLGSVTTAVRMVAKDFFFTRATSCPYEHKYVRTRTHCGRYNTRLNLSIYYVTTVNIHVNSSVIELT